ncbi:hypothetical protein FJY94_02295 [Candidatus Kaiserbacteria bacterium]|nr:hypothetical protein [Candidatus Kaiserbacteria bacterium]
MRAVYAVVFLASLFIVPCAAFADQLDEQRAQLEAQLAQLEEQIAKNKNDLSITQAQRASFEREVAIVNGKIKDAELAIKARDLTIKKILGDVSQKQKGIQSLDARVAAGRNSIAQMIRRTHEIDETPMVVLALGSDLPSLLDDLDSFASVERALGNAFTEMATQRTDLAKRKEALMEQQEEEEEMRKLQVLQRSSLKGLEAEKKTLVAAAKGQESRVKKTIADNEKSAAQIRAALFSLRDSTKTVTFGDMFSYAKEAGALTGVRPALILGILREESNLGQNVGKGNWKVDMHPTRDVPVFEEICRELGLDPNMQPVSKKPWYGYGGAMGPAQFIPSTWVLYKDRIAKAVGQNPPNPWDARTAVFATALLMKDNGADKGTREAERLAALRYLAGWKNATKPAYAFYGDDVMGFADKYQKDIDILGG